MRDLTDAQARVLAGPVTKPIYLVEANIDGVEYFSTNGDQEFEGRLYRAAELRLQSISNWSSAVIRFAPTPERAAQVVSQSWRRGRCRVTHWPATEYPLLMKPGYVKEGYALEGVVYADPILLVDGELTAASVTDTEVSFTVENLVSVGRWLPGVRIAPPLCHHLPRPGTVIVWEGDRYTLEAR